MVDYLDALFGMPDPASARNDSKGEAMSFQDDLWADEQYVDLMAQCRDAWLVIDHRLFTQPGFDWTVEMKQYERLCELREARYVAVRRAWEDKE